MNESDVMRVVLLSFDRGCSLHCSCGCGLGHLQLGPAAINDHEEFAHPKPDNCCLLLRTISERARRALYNLVHAILYTFAPMMPWAPLIIINKVEPAGTISH